MDRVFFCLIYFYIVDIQFKRQTYALIYF